MICGSLLGISILLSACSHRATGHAFVLKDHIRRDWTNQLVRVRFETETPCPSDFIRLFGPAGAVPVQLSNVEYEKDSRRVRSADLNFLVPGLDALSERVYRVRCSPRPDPAPGPEAGLTIVAGAGRVTVETGRLGVELAVGDHAWPTPVLPEDVPGPLVALRLPGGARFGGSAFYGETPVTRWRGEMTAEGPVFAEVVYRLEYADGIELTLTARLTAGDSAIHWDMETRGGARPDDGIRFLLSPGLPPLTFVFRGEFYSKRGDLEMVGREVKPGDLLALPLEAYPEPLITRLTPWHDWWDDTTQTAIVLRLGDAADAALAIISRDAGRWVVPAAPGTRASHGSVYPRMMPLRKLPEGDVALDAPLTDGERAWTMNLRTGLATDDGEAMDDAALLRRAPATRIGLELSRLQDWVLAWDGDEGVHPRVYAARDDIEAYRARIEPDPAELQSLLDISAHPPHRVHWRADMLAMSAWLMTGSREIGEQVLLADRLRHHLDLLGRYDTMRNSSRVAILYDLLIDSDLIAPEERPVLQAQMAYLGYYLASPENWSMERGYASGNLNMSVAHVLNLGVLAAVIAEHPMAAAWSASALAMMDQWLDENVGPAGEFLGSGESQANYAPVSAAKMITYGIAATRAGFRNFADDPRLRALALCLAQQMTPPDVRFPDSEGTPIAGTPASGRGPKGQRHGLAGMMARATADSDPAYAAVMQWSWARTGYSTGYLRDRMSGLESVYMDPALPAAAPDWELDVFPRLGAIMRHGVGSDFEWYINFLLEPVALTAFESESGGFPGIWARGVPVSVRFGGKGYGEREELLISRVLPAREVGTDESRRRQRLMGIGGPRRVTATSALPRQQYVAADISMRSRHRRRAHYDLVKLPAWPPVEREGGLPVQWQRQILFVRDETAEGANYLVLRDTVNGNQPTIWQFWTLSEKIAAPADLDDVEAFLADKPGESPRDARPLAGDRFTALGQWGVDLDYYIAAPRDTPRHTLRWGTRYHIPMQHAEFQDLLHLQLPGDGVYYVALFPRDRRAAPCRFEAMGDGHVIRVQGPHGTDHVFLSAEPAEAEADGIRFHGVAASVRSHPEDGRSLSLGAAGSVELSGGIRLASDDAAELHIDVDWTVTVPDGPLRARVVRLRAPAPLVLHEAPPGVELTGDAAEHVLVLPDGVRRVRLQMEQAPRG